MSTTYNPDSTLVTSTGGYASKAISSSTNASPIVVTTSTTHGYANGDVVQIENHATNTNANGLWTIVVLTSNTFSLTGSTGNGVGGATGYAIDYSLQPLLTLPSGGDTRNVSSVNTPIEGIGNFAPYLFQRVGASRLYWAGQAGAGSMFGATSATALNSSTWTALTGLSSITLTSNTPSTQQLALKQGDRLRLTFTCSMSQTANSVIAIAFGIGLSGGAVAAIQQSSVQYSNQNSGCIVPASIVYDYQYSGGVAAGEAWAVSIMGLSSASTPTLTLAGFWGLRVQHYRSNA